MGTVENTEPNPKAAIWPAAIKVAGGKERFITKFEIKKGAKTNI